MRQILLLLIVAVTVYPAGALADQEKAIRLLSARSNGQFRNTLDGIERGTEPRLTLQTNRCSLADSIALANALSTSWTPEREP